MCCRVQNLLKGKRESEPQVGVCVVRVVKEGSEVCYSGKIAEEHARRSVVLTVTWCSLFFLCGCDRACLLLGRTADLKGGGGALGFFSHFSGHWLFCECPKLGRADTVVLLCVPSRRSPLFFFFPPQHNPSCTLCRSLVRFLCPILSLSPFFSFRLCLLSLPLAGHASRFTRITGRAHTSRFLDGQIYTGLGTDQDESASLPS